ncbi:unnamed protein product [[Candida] boidinii]|uniref:Unnamed protein product n=1 Tax=Candida boidinii TaxID=5477 RepID=A0A9W6WJR6_CANBO|nr:unnamed protein product [[Candida] boidinii]
MFAWFTWGKKKKDEGGQLGAFLTLAAGFKIHTPRTDKQYRNCKCLVQVSPRFTSRSITELLEEIASSVEHLSHTKAKPSSGFSSFFGASSASRYEEAADIYTQAANIYKLQRKNALAGQTFEKAANAQIKADSNDEASNTLVEAYKSYKMEVPIEAARCLSKAIEMFVARGQFRRGANFKVDLAELYENELTDVKNAIASYEDAAEWNIF